MAEQRDRLAEALGYSHPQQNPFAQVQAQKDALTNPFREYLDEGQAPASALYRAMMGIPQPQVTPVQSREEIAAFDAQNQPTSGLSALGAALFGHTRPPGYTEASMGDRQAVKVGVVKAVPRELEEAYRLGLKHRQAAGGQRPGNSFYQTLPQDELDLVSWGGDHAWDAFYNAGTRGLDIPVHARGYRYGDAPESGRSYNYKDQTPESGVSMAHVDHPDFPSSDWEKTISAQFGIMDRPKRYYDGWVLRGHYGSDGEPLMVLPRLVKVK